MIIKRIKTNPFGGLSETEIFLKNGLNVIFGPNEAGKSTLFRAIQKGLFTIVHLTKPEFNKQILPFIPVGGDTASIEIEFSVKESNYLLQKSWGSTKTCKLTQSDGSVLTDDDAISSRLQELLPASEGTFNSTLLSYQSGLTYTISELSESKNTLSDIGDILRQSILNTDGISIDTFRQRVNGLEKDFLGRWDLIANRPEDGKGIEDPWLKGTGRVIKSFYSLETIRQMLFRVKTFDDQYDEVNKRIVLIREETRNRNEYLVRNEKAVNDARERRILIAEQNAITREIDQIKKINSDWPVVVNKMEDIKNQLPIFEKNIVQLREELKIEKQIESNRNIIDKLERVISLNKLANESESELGKIKKITREDLDIIRTARNDIEIIEGSLAAGKLAVKVKTSKELSLQVQTDLNDALSTTLVPSKPVHFEAKGRIIINHPDMAIEVSSCEGNFEQIIKRHMDAMNRFNVLLQQYQVSSIEDAMKINADYELRFNAFARAKSNLEIELGGDTIDALEDRIKSLSLASSGRNTLTIGVELTNKENEFSEKTKEKDRYEKQIKEYEQVYSTPDDLMLKLAEVLAKSKVLDQKLKSLTPLPPEVTDVEQFIELFEAENVRLDNNKKDLSSLEIQRATLEGQAPDSTSEELQIQFNQAEKVFNSSLKRAYGIARLKEKLDALSEQIDTGTYSSLEGIISQYLSEMTGGKYSNIAMKESLPDGFIRSDGKTIRIDLLSTGTKDILGLAVRLAMSKFFLQGSDGFIAMDDPLVDLDPERQQRSAEVLKAFACDKQLIIFTCHPSHAALLGGNKMTLN
jgi:DNA repair protein SbcC/Rad50